MSEQNELAAVTSGLPAPDVNHPDLAPFWEGTRGGRLLVPRCDGCLRHIWPPRPACPRCRSLDATWSEVPGRGTLFTWTVIHRPSSQSFADLVPFAVAVVEIEEHPVRIIGRVVEAEPADLRVGDHMEVTFVRISQEAVVPVWRPAGKGSHA